MRKITKNSKCEYPDCDKKATDAIYTRKLEKVILCCELHAQIMQNEGSSEDWHTCENCHCMLPIN